MRKIFVALITILFFVAAVTTVFANTNPHAITTSILDKNQVVNHNYYSCASNAILDGTVNGDTYIAGSRVDVSGTVNGDLVVAGGQVNIDGTINGDILVAGGQVTVRGSASQNLRVIGGNVLILGSVGRNVSVIGGTITVDSRAKISGNAAFAGGNVELLTEVKNLSLTAGSATIGSEVLGNVSAGAGSLYLSQNAKIDGNLDYWSQEMATINRGATVSGSVTFHKTQASRNYRQTSEETVGAVGSFIGIVSFIGSLILGLLVLWLMPNYSKKTADLVTGKFWLSLLTGFIILVIVPILALILMITLVGFPVALYLIFAYLLFIYTAKIFVALAIGCFISERFKWKLGIYWVFVAGLILYYILGIIPLLGFFVKLIALLTGLGALFLQSKYHFASLRAKKMI